jgi:hypothetical protein
LPRGFAALGLSFGALEQIGTNIANQWFMFSHFLAAACILVSSSFGPTYTPNAPLRFSLDLGSSFSLQFEEIKPAESGMVYRRATLLRHGQLIFRDDLNEFQVSGEYPQLIPVEDGYEIILQNKISPYLSNLLALSIREDKVISVQRLPLPLLPLQDIDDDGRAEGFGLVEEYIEIDAENITYSPVIAWERGPEGIQIDSVASAKLTLMVFGQYNGLEPKPRVTCPCRKRAEEKLVHIRKLVK